MLRPELEPSLGIRSFGDDPEQVARLTAGMVTGFSEAGVLATLKHFPGSGEADVDPHYELPQLGLGRDRLEKVELPPFRAGVAAGAELLMVAHQVVPALTGSNEVSICASETGISLVRPIRAQVRLRGDLGCPRHGASIRDRPRWSR